MENEKTTDKPVEKTADKASGNSTAGSADKPAATSAGKPAARPADHAAERAAMNPGAKSADQAAPKQAAEPSEKPAAKSADVPAAKSAEGAPGNASGRRRTRQTGSAEGQQEGPRSGQRDDRQESRQPARRDERQDSRQSAQRDSQQSGRQSAERSRRQSEQQNTPQSGQKGGRRSVQQNTRQDARSDRQGGRQESRRPERPARKAETPAVKKPFSAWTWRDYALQLSVVVIGIVVTFVGSGLIERWSRQRQLTLTMQLVVDELTTNRNALSEVCGQLEYDRQGMLMFMDYDRLEDIPADSLSRYGLILSVLPSYRPQQEALEVLRSSDMVSTVGDKKLLADIFGCYNRLNDFRENVGMYAGRKQDVQNHLFMNSPGFSLDPMGSLGSWKTIMADPMCAAFIGTSAYFFGGSEYFHRTLREVDAIIAAIREKYGVE